MRTPTERDTRGPVEEASFGTEPDDTERMAAAGDEEEEWEPPAPLRRAYTPHHETGASRRSAARGTPPRTLGSALLASAAATIAPGAGHLLLKRRRTGAVILGVFVLCLVAVALLVLTTSRSALLQNLISSRVLVLVSLGCLATGLAWVAVIVRTYMLARPRGLDAGRQAVGVVVVAALCLLVAAPLGFAANLANSQRGLLDTLFNGGGGTSVADAIAKPRLNILLVGSDAGPDRIGTRTDTMMVASIDTKSGRTTLLSLPRNIAKAQFPKDSAMGKKFPNGFHDHNGPSGDYYLNAVYAWALGHPQDAPSTPTADPGLNLLHQTVSTMLGIQLDYYAEVNMAGFAAIIDALGGLIVDVGPERLPIGGIGPHGENIKPLGYIEPGIQHLDGQNALAFARSRTGTSDYVRMGRQRCLLQNILSQKSPADLLTNFQAVAKATTNSVSTNIPQEVLPALVSLADTLALESLPFDTSLADPQEPDGKFDTGDPNFTLMRKVVQDAINRDPAAAPPVTAAAPTSRPGAKTSATATAPPASSTAPTSLADSCG